MADDAWPLYYEKLLNFLKLKDGKVVMYPYLITKFEFKNWSLEFSSPRIENFLNLNLHSHHNFSAILSSNLTFNESFKRRDFTINAIGLNLQFKANHAELIDPYLGKKDLEQKILKNIDQHFFLDSVRFLRLVRFYTKYNYSIAPEIDVNMKSFNLSGLSKFHFASEMFKTDPGAFLNFFTKLVFNNQLEIPIDFNFWLDLKLSWPVGQLKTKEDILIYVYTEKRGDAHKIQNFFSMPQKILKQKLWLKK